MGDVTVRFYGVRGSYPVPKKEVIRYGGNTATVQITAGDQRLILDAGTGLINIGNEFRNGAVNGNRIDLFLTHLHLDHIQGLPFFHPVFNPRFEIHIYYPDFAGVSGEDTIYSLFNAPISPISMAGIRARLVFHKLPLKGDGRIDVNERLRVFYIWEDSHPLSGVLIFKVCVAGKEIVYATDVESRDGFKGDVLSLIRDCDVLIHDSQYFEADYYDAAIPKEGFGHSTCAMAVRNAVTARASRLVLFHYDPEYSDEDVEKMGSMARDRFANSLLASESEDLLLRS